jgi:hypothetical protein
MPRNFDETTKGKRRKHRVRFGKIPALRQKNA